MTNGSILLAHHPSGALGSWSPVWGPLAVFGVVVAVLLAFGRPSRRGWAGAITRIPDALHRTTGIPGWAAAAVGTSLFALLLAGIGFYSDVAWHVGLGRDEQLFTPPHTAIVLGLALIAASAGIGVLVATLSGARVGFRVGAVRVPWSMVPLGALGVAALTGFPLDELWHQRFGIDVTMWSPTHLLMIVGASLSPLAAWLALAEAGVRPRDSRWARGVHVVTAWLTLLGLSSVQGEFAFGVPQFQQLFHPVLVSLAAGFALVAMRIVLGAGWTVGIAVFSLIFEVLGPLDVGALIVDARSTGLYVVSALAVEAVALGIGTRRRIRFAVVSGLAVATVGLAGEWWWNQRAFQPWGWELLPEAVVVSAIAAVGAAVLAASFTRAVDERGTSVGVPTVVAAGVAVLVALALPLPRQVGDVRAVLDVEPAGRGLAMVSVTLDPADAAEDARWFQMLAWQGGGMEAVPMRRTGSGTYVTERPVPVDGHWKTVLRLHRGAEMMAVPVRFPADEEYGDPAIPPVDRESAFVAESLYLMRESAGASGPFAMGIAGTVLMLATVWIAAFVLAATRIASTRRSTPERSERGDGGRPTSPASRPATRAGRGG